MGSLCHKDNNLLWESLKPSTAPGLVLHTPCSSSLSDWVRQGWQLTLELQHLERRGRRVTTSLRLSWLKASQGFINRPFLKVSKGNKKNVSKSVIKLTLYIDCWPPVGFHVGVTDFIQEKNVEIFQKQMLSTHCSVR